MKKGPRSPCQSGGCENGPRKAGRAEDLERGEFRGAARGGSQQGLPARTRKKDSMSESVPLSPSPLKSGEPQAGQQAPPRQAKKASMSASLPTSPSPLKSAVHVGGLPRFSVHRTMLPVSPPPQSSTISCQVPALFSPANAASGFSDFHVPHTLYRPSLESLVPS